MDAMNEKKEWTRRELSRMARMKFEEGRSTTEIAKEFGLPESVVRAQLSIIKRKPEISS